MLESFVVSVTLVSSLAFSRHSSVVRKCYSTWFVSVIDVESPKGT